MRLRRTSALALIVVGVTLAGCGGREPTSRVAAAHHAESTVIGGTALSRNPNAEAGYPDVGSQPEVLISRPQYLLSWNKNTREINWAAWRLSADNLGDVKRTNKFVADSDLDKYVRTHGGKAVQGTDYTKSCFDRGHQTPSGDRTDTTEDNRETFLMSNMIPQTAWLNRVVWEHLEAHSRNLVQGTDNVLYIYSGPIFDDRTDGIGPNDDIRVPSANFKIITQADGKGNARVIASVVMPNVTSTGSDPRDDHQQACDDQHHMYDPASQQPGYENTDWEKYRASLSDIEEQSGLDLSFLQ